jgi:hypothetical protein
VNVFECLFYFVVNFIKKAQKDKSSKYNSCLIITPACAGLCWVEGYFVTVVVRKVD